MNKPLPDDFPGMDLAAWCEALPFPGQPQAESKPKRTRPPTLAEFEAEMRGEIRQVVGEALDAMGKPAPFSSRGVRRRKEKP